MGQQLLTLVSWKAGFDTDFSVSVGKSFKYLDRFIPGELWERILGTFGVTPPERLWESLFQRCGLFTEVSGEVAGRLGIAVPPYGETALPYLRSLEGGGR